MVRSTWKTKLIISKNLTLTQNKHSPNHWQHHKKLTVVTQASVEWKTSTHKVLPMHYIYNNEDSWLKKPQSTNLIGFLGGVKQMITNTPQWPHQTTTSNLSNPSITWRHLNTWMLATTSNQQPTRMKFFWWWWFVQILATPKFIYVVQASYHNKRNQKM